MQSDTTYIQEPLIKMDSLADAGDNNAILLTGSKSIENNNFPYTEFIHKEVNLDWILYISLGIMVIFAWANIIFTRFLSNIFFSGINFQLSQKVFKNPNLVQKRISNLFGLIYYISFGIYLFLILNYFEFSFFNFNNFLSFLTLMGFLGALSLIRIILYKGAGLFFNQLKLFNEALFHNFLYNKLIGIIIVPFNILIIYTLNTYQDIIVYVSLFLILGISLMRFFRAFVFIRKSVISLFYFILYLCSLEILPALIIVKLILLLAKVS